MFRSTRYFLIAFNAALASVSAADGWAQIKAGMSAEQALAALGAPLLRTANRGFQVWTYSDRAEVLFHDGPVIAWTVPTPSRSVAKGQPISADVNVLPGGIILRTMAVGPRSVLDQAYVSVPEVRFRYNAVRPR